jgi:butyryl-CoA dehydrogenase
LKDSGKPFSKKASMAKFCLEAAIKHTKAVQIYGGFGYVKGVKVERLMRDAKVIQKPNVWLLAAAFYGNINLI